MSGGERSLLGYLDVPVLVGDPDGRAAYLNPAFERRFDATELGSLGRPLAELFEGGAREAVLRAVARVCERGESVRFRMRAGSAAYAAVASPIVAEAARVGVVILFKEEVEGVERLLALQREIREPIEEIGRCLDGLLEQTGGRRGERHRHEVEDALRALARLRKWSEEVAALLEGEPPAAAEEARFDPAELLRAVGERLRRELDERRTELRILVAGALPPLRGDAARLESLLLHMLRSRLEAARAPEALTLSARAAGEGAVLLSVTETAVAGGYGVVAAEAPPVQEELAALGGELHAAADPKLGRTALLRLPVARSAPRER